MFPHPPYAVHRTFGHLLPRRRPRTGPASRILGQLTGGSELGEWEEPATTSGGAAKNHLVPAEHGFDAYCDVKFRPDDGDYARWGHTPRPFAQTGNQADPSLPDWRGAPGSDTYYRPLLLRGSPSHGSTRSTATRTGR